MRGWLTIPLLLAPLVFGSLKRVPRHAPTPRMAMQFTHAKRFLDTARHPSNKRLASLLLPSGEPHDNALIYADSEQVITAIGSASADHGAALFSGRTRLQRGGPPCIACHTVAGLSFPGGGTLGPDLTHTYTKLGPEGIDAALQTLFFPAMTPLYEAHQLTPQERSDLKAFFQREDKKEAREDRITVVLIAIALCGMVIFLIIAGLIWRGRLKGVRKNLVESASR